MIDDEARAVCERIRSAFAGVRLGDGIGLREAQVIDDYGDENERARARERDETEDWQRIAIADLNACHSSLSFFDPAGMRFHLPAFLIADVEGSYTFEMAFCLTHDTDYTRSRFTILSKEQMSAVRAFLLWASRNERYAFERADILRSLETFWRDEDQSVA